MIHKHEAYQLIKLQQNQREEKAKNNWKQCERQIRKVKKMHWILYMLQNYKN